jgi:short-subunit dehydrogenase
MTRPLADQVVVITGASSGIGRETAVALGRRGASVVLAARNALALREVADEIRRAGGTAVAIECDVADREQVEALAQEALSHFGRVDTWINNAGVSIFGLVEDMTVEEIERVIRVDLLGVIYGCKAILPHMRERGEGTIINIGSAASYRVLPLQTPYSAAKHGVKAFTDGLRLELQHEGSGINVTLIAPGSINTPFFSHARSKMHVRGRPPPPVFEPSVVADAIIIAAEHPRRDIFIGATGKIAALAESVSPAIVDRVMLAGDVMFRQQQADALPPLHDNLFTPVLGSGAISGEWDHLASTRSPFTRLSALDPTQRRLLLGAGVIGALVWMRARH